MDDIVLVSPDPIEVQQTQELLQSLFKLKSLGDLTCFLSLEIASATNDIHLCQRKYIFQLLMDTGFIDAMFNDDDEWLLEDVF